MSPGLTGLCQGVTLPRATLIKPLFLTNSDDGLAAT